MLVARRSRYVRQVNAGSASRKLRADSTRPQCTNLPTLRMTSQFGDHGGGRWCTSILRGPRPRASAWPTFAVGIWDTDDVSVGIHWVDADDRRRLREALLASPFRDLAL